MNYILILDENHGVIDQYNNEKAASNGGAEWVLILDEPWGEASLREGNCDSHKSLCWSVGTGLSMQYVKHRVRERGVETWKKAKCEEACVCVEGNREK